MKKKDIEYYYIKNGSTDCHLFHEGNNENAHKFIGAHKLDADGDNHTVRFVVWAPNATSITLMGDFNQWNEFDIPMERIDGSGIWGVCVKGVKEFDAYKYRIVSPWGEVRYKADPFAFHAEERPKSASKYYHVDGYKWGDKKWENSRKKQSTSTPMNIYELNLSSWRRKDNNQYYTYRDLADELVDYVKEMGYTHVEIMPITEYPYDGSWGYQVTGYFAPTSRFGTPKDLMYLVDSFHKRNIGVILDWVPVHFCKDDHGLARFDGTNCYEYVDQYRAENDQWGTLNFDFSKPEVVNFLISSALYWLEYYHIDGIRVDAVAYMIYLNFTGKNISNEYGGNECLEAIEFIKKLNTIVHKHYPNALMIAEESTSWPLLTSAIEDGGLGFDYKWNMGWMNDILEYMKMDPIFRKDHHSALTFTMMYAHSENYILPFSHDEVVHMKGSMISKMPGTYEEKFMNLKLLYSYMFAHPGKKLMFMGDEFAQFDEWNDWGQLTWQVLDYEKHQKFKKFVKELNGVYKKEKSLFQLDSSSEGFQWLDFDNNKESVIAFERIDFDGDRIICVFNFTPVLREKYRIGVLEEGTYSVLLNTSLTKYGGDIDRNKPYKSKNIPCKNRELSIEIDLQPLSGMYIKIKKNREV